MSTEILPAIVGTPEIEYHRNGVSGEGFFVVRALWKIETYIGADQQSMMMAVVFPPDPISDEDDPMYGEPDWGIYERGKFDNPRVAIFDEALLPDVRFTHNSWRGDNFAPALYQAIRESR